MTDFSLSPVFQTDSAQIDANGAPRSGAKLFTYLAGTSTKTTVKKDSLGAASHTNPIIFDANGLPPAPIWLAQGLTYKFYLAAATDTDPPTSPLIPVIDNITGINDVADIVSTEWTPSGMTPTYISATTFSVPTDQTTTLDVNRRLKLTVTAGTRYGYITKSTYTSLTTVTVLLDSGSLDSGLSAFSYGIVSAANTSLPFLSRDQQCGRLGYVSATQIRLDPLDGNTIWVYTAAAGWARRAIPSAGITAANTNTYIDGVSGQSLVGGGSPGTYYVYLFDNSGTLTLDFSTTAPAVDATSGLKIKTGVATRLLIGMVRMNSSTPGQFQSGNSLVLSWYKRRNLQVTGTALSAASTASTGFVELQAAAEAKFQSWAEEAIQAVFVGNAYMDAVGRVFYNYVTIDGISTVIGALVAGTSYANLAQLDATCGGFATVTDGHHYVTLAAKVSAGTGNWDAGVLQVMTRG